MNSIRCAVAAPCLGAVATFSAGAAADDDQMLGAVEAIDIATQVYIYGYPLVTFDMVRR
jgi:hypothetical protein